MWPFTKKVETRAAASGFSASIMAAREAYISGSRGLAELTATVQSCVSLWEAGFILSDVEGTQLLTRSNLAIIARSAALRGECVLLIDGDELHPCADWELSTRYGKPRAYRLSLSEAGGGISRTALAAEVIHLRVAADAVSPWAGRPPLERASLTASTLHALEETLREIYETAPLGSQVVPFPENAATDNDALGREFRGKRGRVLLRESVSVTAAGGPAPMADWRPADLTPDLEKSLIDKNAAAARESTAMAFGVLPALLNNATTGPMVREAQRHLAQWQLQPMAALLAEECTAKLGSTVTLDCMRPLQAFDQGGRARAVSAVVKAMAEANEAGIDIGPALKLMDWEI